MKIRRKVNDKEYIYKLLDLKTNKQLRQICRDYKIRGFSKHGKTELVNFVLNSLTEEQMEEVFEIQVTLIFTETVKSSLDWELEEIYDIIKNIYPEYDPYGRCVDIEKKDFKNIEVTGGIKEKRLDFTISFGVKMMQPSITTYEDGTTIERDYIFTLRKIDFISIQEVNQEGNTSHHIYQINFGDFPESSSAMNTVKNWLILASLYIEDKDYNEAIHFYEIILNEFEISDDVKIDILKNLEKAKKAINKKF